MSQTLTLLLPALHRFGGQSLGLHAAKAWGQGDGLAVGQAGRDAQLRRHVQLPGAHWPLAALSRQADAQDADGFLWLRADPAWLQADINGVRLMAIGPALAPTAHDCQALLPPLQALFAQDGWLLDAPTPERWYLRLPLDTALPTFAAPDIALGDDLFETDAHENTAEARRWRAIASEVQILLHNHPHNALRQAQGAAPINALWFWGAGTLPRADAPLELAHRFVCTSDAILHALAASESAALPLPAQFDGLADALADAQSPQGNALPKGWQSETSWLVDLASSTDLRYIEAAWLLPALQAMRDGQLAALCLDSEDGTRLCIKPWHRWRLWRAAVPRPGAPAAKGEPV